MSNPPRRPSDTGPESTAELAAALNALRMGSAFDDLEEEAPEATQVLDPKQQQELMALRAQQSMKLSRLDKQIVVMFTDLVGSTQYYERYGDIKGREKVLTHNALLFPIVQGNGGVIVKTIGDAIMGYYGSPDEALKAAAQMQQALAAYNRQITDTDEEIHIRVALNAGVAIAQEGDIYGDVVNVAARIEHQAKADEVLMGQSVQGLLKKPWPIESAGQATFKGKAEPIALFRLRWKDIAGRDATPRLLQVPDRYDVKELLARGSTGELYLAEDRATKVIVVVKTLYEHYANDPQTKAAFLSAARESKGLVIDGIVRVIDCPPEGSQGSYLITELVEGTSLGTIVSRVKLPAFLDAAAIALKVGRVLAAAHDDRVLHGNVDPDSVLVRKDGRVLLTNFGMAQLTTVQVRKGNSPPGTLAFIAPERLLGNTPNERSDVYSLGALLYFLLSGKEPVEDAASLEGTIVAISGGAVPLRRANPDVPPELATIVSKAMAMMPRTRHASIPALIGELQTYLATKDHLKDTAARQYLMRGLQAGATKPVTVKPLPKPIATDTPKAVVPVAPEEDSDLASSPPTVPMSLDASRPPWRDMRVIAAAIGVLLLGVLIGRMGGDSSPPPHETMTPARDSKTVLAWLDRAGALRGASALVVIEKGKTTLEWSSVGKSTLQYAPGAPQLAASIVLGRMIEDQKIRSLDDPVHVYFSSWKQGRKRYVTLRHLLAQSSGLANDAVGNEIETADDAVQLALAAELDVDPGRLVRENDKALALLGGLIEKASGKRYAELVEKALAPLGISEMRWKKDKSGFALPHSLALHPRDTATLIAAALRGGNDKLIRPAWLATLSEPVATNETLRRLGWVLLDDVPRAPRFLPSTALDGERTSFAMYAPQSDVIVLRLGAESSAPVPSLARALVAGYGMPSVLAKTEAMLPAPAPPIQLPALDVEQAASQATSKTPQPARD